MPAMHGDFKIVKEDPNRNEESPDSFSAKFLKNLFNLSGVLNKRESLFHASIHCHNPNIMRGMPSINLIANPLNNVRAPSMKKVNKNPIMKYIRRTPEENPSILDAKYFFDGLAARLVPKTPVIKIIQGESPDRSPVTNAIQYLNS